MAEDFRRHEQAITRIPGSVTQTLQFHRDLHLIRSPVSGEQVTSYNWNGAVYWMASGPKDDGRSSPREEEWLFA